jgi:hypothetical protein
MSSLTLVSRLANEEFVRKAGVRLFEVPARQLFVHNARGDLIVNPDAQANRRVLAQLALRFECDAASGVSLQRSLKLGRDGSSLLYATGCKLLCAVAVTEDAPHMIALALIMNLKAPVLEPAVLRRMGSSHLPLKALYLELVCAAPHTGGATYLLLRLLAKLERTNTGILAYAVNAKSRALLARHFYTARGTGVYYLTREDAERNIPSYMDLLRTTRVTRDLCTRRGLSRTTAGRTYWDCR